MALPIPKPPQKPVAVPKPGLFDKGRQVPVRELLQKAKIPTVIPGTGGQQMFKGAHVGFIKKYLPYKQVGSYLTIEEAKTILRKMRKEEYDKGLPPSRERRTLEQDLELKGKY